MPDNALEIQVIAGMRSGHHAVIHWLLCHFAGPVLFRNNALWAEHLVYRNVGGPGRDGSPEQRAAFARADAERRQPKDCYLFNLEDRPLAEAARLLAEERDRLAWGTSARVVRLLVLRDLPNFVASRLRADGVGIPAFPCTDWSGLWASHAREAAGETRLVPDLVPVSYNAWVSDPGYRRRLSARLGLEHTDAGLHHVPRIGAGSSFDGRDYDGRAQQMAVLDRWREVADDPELGPEYRAFTRDPELRFLSNLLFGLPEDPWAEGARPILGVRRPGYERPARPGAWG